MSENEKANVKPPAEAVRCYYGWAHVIGEYTKTAVVAGLGGGFCIYYALNVPFPLNFFSVIYLAFIAFFLFMSTRYDYAWIEVKGATIRLKHLYSRKVVERRIDEIEEVRTVVLSARTVTDSWLGKIKAVKIRFRDGGTPISIFRSGPAMTNATELIEAIVFRMSEIGKIDADIAETDGESLIRRIFWQRT